MLADLGLTAEDVESHSGRVCLGKWGLFTGNDDILGSPSSLKRSLDLRLRNLGADLGEEIAQAELGEERPSNSFMARMVCDGGDGELIGLSWKMFLGSLGHFP